VDPFGLHPLLCELIKNVSEASVGKVRGDGSTRKSVILILKFVQFFQPMKGVKINLLGEMRNA
jgi:hypothetical protein